MSDRSLARAASGAGAARRTRSERILWDALRTREPGWFAEVPTCRYRLDFFCPDLRLAVEVDGASHWGERARKYDEKRDLWHLEHGIRTVRVSAREVERDLAFVMQHIDEAAARRRLEFAIMPPSLPPIWEIPTPREAPQTRRSQLPRAQPPARRPGQPRRRGQGRRQEPSWLALGLAVLALGAFLDNWIGAQDAYRNLTQRGAEHVANSLTDDLGPQLLVPRPVTAATVCPTAKPACGHQVPTGQVQLLADRMNMAVPATPPPPDLRCNGQRSSVLAVTFVSSGRTTMVEVLPACRVFRIGGIVRRATPGVLGQVTSPEAR